MNANPQSTRRVALVIDDMDCIRRLVVFSLVRAGFDVIEAANGREGLEQLDRRAVDVVIVDLNMPVMDGLDFLRAMRARVDGCKVPAVLLTTDIGSALKEKARTAGASGCIQKPFDPRAVAAVIQKLVP